MRIFLLLALIVIAGVAHSYFAQPQPSPINTHTDYTPPKNQVRPDPVKEAAEAAFLRDVLAVRELRNSMKNPKSFQLEKAIRTADGSLCLAYWASNLSNEPGQAVITAAGIMTSGHKSFRREWNARCKGKTGEDLISIRQQL